MEESVAKPLDIHTYGDPVLRQKAKNVKEITPEIRSLIARMWNAMYENKGVGLAAPQVGVLKKIIIVDTQEEGGKYAVINPRIVKSSEEQDFYEEGCLSIPDIRGDVLRPIKVEVQGMDPAGNPFRIEAEGLLARVFQHEIDHLNGVLFVDRLQENQKMKLELKLKELTQKTKEQLVAAS